MNILFDTNAWLWLHREPHRLSEAARETLADPRNELHLSAVVPWEMAIKQSRHKLRLEPSFEAMLQGMLAAVSVRLMAVEQRHVVRYALLPLLHKDPFDRMLIAQAQVEGLTILTADPHFRRYDVAVLAA